MISTIHILNNKKLVAEKLSATNFIFFSSVNLIFLFVNLYKKKQFSV